MLLMLDVAPLAPPAEPKEDAEGLRPPLLAAGVLVASLPRGLVGGVNVGCSSAPRTSNGCFEPATPCVPGTAVVGVVGGSPGTLV